MAEKKAASRSIVAGLICIVCGDKFESHVSKTRCPDCHRTWWIEHLKGRIEALEKRLDAVARVTHAPRGPMQPYTRAGVKRKIARLTKKLADARQDKLA